MRADGKSVSVEFDYSDTTQYPVKLIAAEAAAMNLLDNGLKIDGLHLGNYQEIPGMCTNSIPGVCTSQFKFNLDSEESSHLFLITIRTGTPSGLETITNVERTDKKTSHLPEGATPLEGAEADLVQGVLPTAVYKTNDFPPCAYGSMCKSATYYDKQGNIVGTKFINWIDQHIQLNDAEGKTVYDSQGNLETLRAQLSKQIDDLITSLGDLSDEAIAKRIAEAQARLEIGKIDFDQRMKIASKSLSEQMANLNSITNGAFLSADLRAAIADFLLRANSYMSGEPAPRDQQASEYLNWLENSTVGMTKMLTEMQKSYLDALTQFRGQLLAAGSIEEIKKLENQIPSMPDMAMMTPSPDPSETITELRNEAMSLFQKSQDEARVLLEQWIQSIQPRVHDLVMEAAIKAGMSFEKDPSIFIENLSTNDSNAFTVRYTIDGGKSYSALAVIDPDSKEIQSVSLIENPFLDADLTKLPKDAIALSETEQTFMVAGLGLDPSKTEPLFKTTSKMNSVCKLAPCQDIVVNTFYLKNGTVVGSEEILGEFVTFKDADGNIKKSLTLVNDPDELAAVTNNLLPPRSQEFRNAFEAWYSDMVKQGAVVPASTDEESRKKSKSSIEAALELLWSTASF